MFTLSGFLGLILILVALVLILVSSMRSNPSKTPHTKSDSEPAMSPQVQAFHGLVTTESAPYLPMFEDSTPSCDQDNYSV